MIKIIIFSDTYKHFEPPIKEYEKRLGKDLEIIKLKPSKKQEINEIINEETEVLYKKLSFLKGFKFLLYIDGKTMSTEELYNFIELKKQTFSDIIFIIGGAYGVDEEKINNLINFKLSFSPMTFPHSMAYLILLEQVYRIFMIKKGTAYHH